MDTIEYIPISKCKHGSIYKIESRNLSYGIYNETTKGFTGLRLKFDMLYLFEEYHWDTGTPYGTVMPISEVEKENISLLDDHKALKLRLFEIEYPGMRQKIYELKRDLWHTQNQLDVALANGSHKD